MAKIFSTTASDQLWCQGVNNSSTSSDVPCGVVSLSGGLELPKFRGCFASSLFQLLPSRLNYILFAFLDWAVASCSPCPSGLVFTLPPASYVSLLGLSILNSDAEIKDFVDNASTFFPIYTGFGLGESIISNLALKYKKKAWFAMTKDFSKDMMVLYDFDKAPAPVAIQPTYNERNIFYGPFEG
ncbi:hypothetical protein Patl1_28182 [Pistacia atlantica]|uniref:Uncharacterized protein n=1 Tax=Pistacia atlantica TaxID=434234 RepID=A0ACC1BFI6_9ROSI|nr:hypothetical protein Patl1_28182 [Pistacia atlantica]